MTRVHAALRGIDQCIHAPRIGKEVGVLNPDALLGIANAQVVKHLDG
jgi:hypothetical protein